MKPELEAVAGSPVWQTSFFLFAALVILFQVVRGWRSGLLRQLVRVAAVIAAYVTAWFGGKLLLPIVRPLVKLPDFAIGIIAGAILALIVYSVLTSVGTILFKRTAQQNSAIIRLLYGLSGAAIGSIFGALLVWVLIIGIRSLGSVAEIQLQSSQTNIAVGTTRWPRKIRGLAQRQEAESSLMISLARLKNSIELGSAGDLVKSADIVPESTYETLGKVGNVVSNPQSAERFLTFPGAKELQENPRIVGLREDPEIIEMIEQGRYFDLVQDQRLIDAANDPVFVGKLKSFEFQKALDYAAKR